jgi:hypothetical protein
MRSDVAPESRRTNGRKGHIGSIPNELNATDRTLAAFQNRKKPSGAPRSRAVDDRELQGPGSIGRTGSRAERPGGKLRRRT